MIPAREIHQDHERGCSHGFIEKSLGCIDPREIDKERVCVGCAVRTKSAYPTVRTAHPTDGHELGATEDHSSIPWTKPGIFSGILTVSGLERTVQVIDYENDYLDRIGQAKHSFFACWTDWFVSIPKMEARVPALLELRAVKKSFGALSALKNVSFSLEPGRVLALVGDNGAGKSTLVKILAGVHGVTHGEVLIEDSAHVFSSPADARAAGIETVYQDLALIEDLDVADNVYLGREVTRGGAIGRWLGLLDRPAMRRETAQVLAQLHIKIPSPQAEIARMSGGQRQAVAIGRAITWGRKLLILDEPTAALGVDETEQVLRMIEELRDRGMTFLVVSHNMRDVHRIADEIVVLRQGVHVATLEKHATSPQEIVEYITGAKTAQPGLGLEA